jgi:hypothetical protein
MEQGSQLTKVLIIVMTYPHPSRGYNELVCTAGITEDLDWVRLYPIDYRYRPRNQQFRKYQWISVNLEPLGTGRDKRKESRKPILDSIRIQGPPLGPENGWKSRRAVIDAMPHYTLGELKQLYAIDRTSLGIVRPRRVLDLKIEPADSAWKPQWQSLFDQLKLFGTPQKPLRKIPYKFSYVFQCEDGEHTHSAMVEDWELGVLFLKEADRLESELAAARSVKEKYLGELCRSDKDTRFFMGTVFPYNSWVVLGVFWPPQQEEGRPALGMERLFP